MNFINCNNLLTPELFFKTVEFWSENSYQHIASLLKSTKGTTAVLQPDFKENLQIFYDEFKRINMLYKSPNQRLPSKPEPFFKVNENFIKLLERLKFEGFSGYPILQQPIFHYIYEQRYINAIFSMKNNSGNVLITTNFLPFQNFFGGCVYNQMYFWSIIGSMHPSLLMDTNAFYNAINGYAKEFLTNVCNSFNKIAFLLSDTKKPIKRFVLREIFEDFEKLNISFLEFLKLAKSNSPQIYSSPSTLRLSQDFYGKVEHMIKEHTLVKEINQNIKTKL